MKTRRRGMTLFITLTLLTILVSLVLVMVRTCVTLHTQRRLREAEVQAALLADAGIERGQARLALDENYTGETWTMPASPSGLERDAEVEIRIVDEPAGRRLRVAARLGAPPRGALQEREIRLPSSTGSRRNGT